MAWLGVFDLWPWIWDSDGQGLRNHESRVKRALNANTAGLSRDAAGWLWGCSPRLLFPRIPTHQCWSSCLIKSALLFWRCQMWSCVNRVTWRPFLLSDLYHKGLFLETAASFCALGKKAGHTLLLFLNISVHLGCVLKCLWRSSEKSHPWSLWSWKPEFWILLIHHGQWEAWS